MILKDKTKKSENMDYKKNISYVIYGSIAMITIIVIILATVLTQRAAYAIRQSAARLIYANCSQIQLNINTYLDKVESNAALLFSDPDYYLYDKTDESLSSYEKLTKEDSLLDRIVDLGIMENYTDFVIVYADNTNVGWLSNSTKELFKGESIYSVLASYINREGTKDGWFDGINDYYDRIFYVKRLNNNALLLVSFYSREIGDVFSLTEDLQGMQVRLMDDKDSILYSLDRDEIGSKLPDSYKQIIGNSANFSYVDKDRVIDVATCNNGWKIVCEMSTDEILNDINILRKFTIIFGVIVIVIFAILIIITIRRLSHPLDKTISTLQKNAETDGLTGLLNKRAFEDKVKEVLPGRKNLSFVMLDMDRFKAVNDTKGHAYGDEVIIRMSSVLKSSLREDTIIGRLGGDEFAFLFNDNDFSEYDLRKIVVSRIEDIRRAFDKEFFLERSELNISLSFGIVAQKYNNEDFSIVYENADKALYVSKENGRDTYTIFEKDMEVPGR